MGSPEYEDGRDDDEGPRHQVRITKLFYLGVHEVTQQEWQEVMGTVPWEGEEHVREGDTYPATYVSWDDAVDFCYKLTGRERRSGELAEAWLYRLPTEAEWEYACRAGTSTRFSFGGDAEPLGEYAWFVENTWDAGEEHPQRVGQKRPNRWGLFDMHGNVWEWCDDWHDKYYRRSRDDPGGPDLGSSRVMRGGSFSDTARKLRSADRERSGPTWHDHSLGFRVARVVEASQLLTDKQKEWLALLDRIDEADIESLDEILRKADGAESENVSEEQEKAADKAKRVVAAPERVPEEATESFENKGPEFVTNSIDMKLVLIPAGEFLMGSPEDEEGRDNDEGPRHRVRITRPFYLGMYEVTQQEYDQVIVPNPSAFSPTGVEMGRVEGLDVGRFPVERVSRHEAVYFCNRLSQREGLKPYYVLDIGYSSDAGITRSHVHIAVVTVTGCRLRRSGSTRAERGVGLRSPSVIHKGLGRLTLTAPNRTAGHRSGTT